MATVFNSLNHQLNQSVLFADPLVSGPITITSTGQISESVAQTGMLLVGGAYEVLVNGLLTATAPGSRGLEFGVAATSSQISNLTVRASGEVLGVDYGVIAFHATNITNSGLIQGANGIYVAGGGLAYTITNDGEIIASAGNAAILTDGAGAHAISNSDTITGRIEGSFSSDSVETITNTGTLNGQIWARGGNDSINNAGLINDDVFLDGGDDSLINTGTISGDINGWEGADTIQNDGTLNGHLLSGQDNDTIGNTGTINGDVNAWLGNDSFTNSGLVTGWIFMGEGNDTLVGGASSENVADEAGRDNYALGDGIDNFDAVGAGTAISRDVVNGGLHAGVSPTTGIYGDVYNASDATQAVSINLDTIARTDSVSGLSYVAVQANGAETGNDIVRGFETVFTGSGNDVVFGNSAANFIGAGAGNDHLFAGLGNDNVDGGAGADVLAGGSGRDQLDAGVDSNLDRFIYTALSDSTALAGGRDTLLNFTEADRIDLDGLGIASLHYVGTGVAFDGLAGAVRVTSTAEGWLIQLDADGNSTADFAIAVDDAAHTAVTNWSDNFIL